MNIINKILKRMIMIIGLNLVYLLFMMGTFLIPTDSIEKNVEKALEIWVDNKEYEYPVFDNSTVYFDNLSDMIWANMSTVKGDNPIYQVISLQSYTRSEDANAFDSLVTAIYYRDNANFATYSRYWNLNVGFLKILFSILPLSNIRYLFFAVSTILMIFLIYRLNKYSGISGSLPIVVAFMITSLNWHAMCLSFISDILISLVSMIFISYKYKMRTADSITLVFAVIGSLTFAMGPLVTPVLPVGLCLILYIQLNKNVDDKMSLWKQIGHSVFWWGMGYGVTMLLKQGLSQQVLGSQDGTQTAWNWIGFDMNIVVRLSNVWDKLTRLFTPISIKMPLFVLLTSILGFMCIKYYKKSMHSFELVFISFFPMFWMMIIARHSIHAFTSNLLCISIYGILCLLMNHIDWVKIEEKRNQKQEKICEK